MKLYEKLFGDAKFDELLNLATKAAETCGDAWVQVYDANEKKWYALMSDGYYWTDIATKDDKVDAQWVITHDTLSLLAAVTQIFCYIGRTDNLTFNVVKGDFYENTNWRNRES